MALFACGEAVLMHERTSQNGKFVADAMRAKLVMVLKCLVHLKLAVG